MTPLAKEIHTSEFFRLMAYYPTDREKKAIKSRYGVALSPYLFPALHLIDFPYMLATVRSHMKIVITLRNPISRMYSHWKWEVLLAGKQRLGDMSFMHRFDTYVDKALELYPCTPMFTLSVGMDGLRSSIYWQAVNCWLDLFGAANVLVLESDEYFRDKAGFMYKIQDFVGLPRVAPPPLHRSVNENPLKFDPPSQETIDKLKSFFRPHNDKLWQIIGKRFDW